MRHIALASVVLVGLTATASAKRVYVPPAPTVTLVRSTSPALVEHLERNDAALVACAANERRAALSVRVSARWDATGRMRSVAVQGGSARFNRCASTALRGPIAVTRRGNGNALIKVPRPGKGTPAIPPTPTPAPKPVAMDSCQADTDCTLYFRTQSCIPGDPIAVNTSQLAAARTKYPMKHDPCGMGGPQYDDLRFSFEGRYHASCVQQTCVVHDAGPQKSPLSPFAR